MLYRLAWWGLLYRLEVGAALYTECTDGGGEDGDDEINDGFPVYFHILLLILMFNSISPLQRKVLFC